MTNLNNTETICTIDIDDNLYLSHGPDANYLFNGHAIQALVDKLILFKKHAKEFFPYVDLESFQAVSIGEPDHEHVLECGNTCPDCVWYDWGVNFMKRKESGEFNEIIG